MSDWSLVGGNPAPGDPNGIRAIATRYGTVSEHAKQAAIALRDLQCDDGVSSWTGDAATRFRAELDGDLLENLGKLERSYAKADTTLVTYASTVERLYGEGLDQLRLATAADDDERNASRQVTERTQTRKTLASRHRADVANVARLRKEFSNPTYAQPGNEALLQQLTLQYRQATSSEASTRGSLVEADTSVNEATGRQNSARERLKRARDQVAEIKGDRDRAVQTAKDGIDDARSEGIRNKRWWEKAGEWAKGAFKWITTLENLSNVLDGLSLVLTVAAAILAFTGVGLPLAAALAGAGKVLNAVSMAVTVARALKGDISWAAAGLTIGLSLVGGKAAGKVVGKAAKPLSKLVPKLAGKAGKLAAKGGKFGFTRLLVSKSARVSKGLRTTLVKGGRAALRKSSFPFQFPRTPLKYLTSKTPLFLKRYHADAPVWAVREGAAAVGGFIGGKLGDGAGSALDERTRTRIERYEGSRERQGSVPWKGCAP